MRPIAVAVIGYGLGGRVFHAPLISAVDGLHLAAIVSSRKDEIAKTYPGVTVLSQVDDVFADPAIDLVVVATPNDSHCDLALKALAAGKHVVIDKPFTCTVEEATRLCAAAKAAGRILSVYHNRRWDGDFLTLKKLIADGVLGEVVSFESRFDLYRPVVQDRWREWEGPSSGTWYDLGAHLLDQALQLFGTPDSLVADLAARRPGAKTTDYFHVLLRYGGMRVVLAGDSLARGGLRFAVHGTRGSYVKYGLDPQQQALAAGIRPDADGFGADPAPGQLVLPGGDTVPVTAVRGNYKVYYEGLRDSLLGLMPVPVSAGEALTVMRYLTLAEAG